MLVANSLFFVPSFRVNVLRVILCLLVFDHVIYVTHWIITSTDNIKVPAERFESKSIAEEGFCSRLTLRSSRLRMYARTVNNIKKYFVGLLIEKNNVPHARTYILVDIK